MLEKEQFVHTTLADVLRSMMRWAMVMLALALHSPTARALEFEAQHPPGNPQSTVIWASGEIKLGDDRKLHEFVAARPAGDKLIGIALNSPGGNLLESHRLAMSIRNTGMMTAVSGTCASGCFLLFVAGKAKMVFPNSRIGVHSASEASIETMGSEAATTEMARTAQSLGTPDAIVGKMVVTPPERMAWLTSDDLRTIPGLKIVTTEELAPNSSQRSDGYQPGSALTPGNGQVPSPTSITTSQPPVQTAVAGGRFSIDRALKAGYTPTQILDLLLVNPGVTNYDIGAARNAGYSDITILQYLEAHDTWGSGPTPASLASLTPSVTSLPEASQNPNYLAGRNARLAWESWFGGLSGDGRDGAGWWAEHRATAARDRLSCESQSLMSSGSSEWLRGCQQARQLLLLADQRRRADVFWKAGWNSL